MKAIDIKSVKVRRMLYNDISPILEISWANIPDKEMITAQLWGPLNLSFIAEFDGHLVGFILARLSYLGLPMAGVAVIHAIATNPEYQNQGIGTLLINALRNHCKAQGIQTMRALISQDDAKTRKFAEHLGFSPSVTINMDQSCSNEA